MSSYDSMDNTVLPHDSINNDGLVTILLIHGGGCTRRSWDAVRSHLQSHYHLLVPDLPSHGQANSIKPFTLDTCTRLLALLIEQKAHNGLAHLVGISIGAYVAIDLAVQHPNLVDSVFASGYNRFEPSWYTPYLSTTAWTLNRLPYLLPKAVTKHFMDGVDVTALDGGFPPSRELHNEFMALLTTGRWPRPWPARTVIVAATKGGVVPSFDKQTVAQQIAKICRESGNQDARAVQHRGMRHPWSAQDPKLFADAVCEFIERRPLPVGFEEV